MTTRAEHYARNPHTGGTMRVITFLIWRTRLWLVGFGARVRERSTLLQLRTTWGENGSFSRFVDRVSPFDPLVGYERVRLRRFLYTLRYPMRWQRLRSLALVNRLVYSLVPEPSLGRYEGSFYDPQRSLKTEWLDMNSEWADATTGDTGWDMWYALFRETSVPWSLEPETWLMKVDSQGFVGAEQYDDPKWAEADFSAYEDSYSRSDELDTIAELIERGQATDEQRATYNRLSDQLA